MTSRRCSCTAAEPYTAKFTIQRCVIPQDGHLALQDFPYF